MEDPILLGDTAKDASPFESEACEKYLQSFQLNLEDLNVPTVEPKVVRPDVKEVKSEASGEALGKVKCRRPTLEINGVQVKPKTLAEYREAIKRKSIDEKPPDDANDENKTKVKSLRRLTIDSPQCDKKKVLSEACNKKKTETCQKSPKIKEEPPSPVSENTVTRSGRVSKKVLKVEKVEKQRKQEDEDSEEESEVVSRKVTKSPSSDYYPNSFLCPDRMVDVDAVDTKVVMYTGAGRHLHSYAIHNYNLLTENTYVTAWRRDFALTALNNNIDNSGRSIFRSTLPLVSKKLIQIRDDLKEGKLDQVKTEVKDEKRRRAKRRKNRKAVWTKTKTHSLSVQNAKKIKEEKDVPVDSENNEIFETETEISVESSPAMSDEVKTLKRKLTPNEEDDLFWEMYGTPHKRVKLKLIQTQSDSNKKPQWTSVNYEKENRPEETEEEMAAVVSTVTDSIVNYVELNNEYNDKEFSLDPTYLEEYKLEEDAAEVPKLSKRKRNNSSRVKWELKRLDVLIFENEADNKNVDGTCNNDFCKLGCICDSIAVRPKNIAINHCSEIDCIFKCVCPAPKRNEQKPPIRDESEIIRSVAEKRNGRNLAKKEKEWIQTLVKTNDEYIIMQSKGNKNKREVKKPERYREESLHWENVAHQKLLYEKVKRSLREKARKADSSPIGEDSNESSSTNESPTVSEKDKKRAEIKLLKRLRKREEKKRKEKESAAEVPAKTSPLKLYFCKEHSVLNCKCKLKEKTEAKTVEDATHGKLKEIEKEINALSANLGNLSSKEKDKLLSLLREQQTLQDSMKQQSNEGKTEDKEELSSASGGDEEYIDLNTLSKFIRNPDEPENEETEAKDSTWDIDAEKGNCTQSGADIEIIENESALVATDCMPHIQIKSVRSLQSDLEMSPNNNDEDDDVEVLDSSTFRPSRQISITPQPSLSIQSPVTDHDPIQAPNTPIDFYGFLLHNGIGYLPISQYNSKQLYLIFKNPTKKDPLPIIFHGADYLQKASTWANSFLLNYVKFHPKFQNPCWKIIQFSSTNELKNWKLFDFKFLKDYAPVIITEEDIFKVKGKILYKLLLVQNEKAFKFKQVMETKLLMDDMDFIDKYEYFHSRRDLLNKPVGYIALQRSNDDDDKDNTKEPSEVSKDSGLEMVGDPVPLAQLSSPSPPSQGKGIFVKSAESLLQRQHVRAKTVSIPSHLPITPISSANHLPIKPATHLHRRNMLTNLNRLATARIQNNKPRLRDIKPAVGDIPKNVVVTPDGTIMAFTHSTASPTNVTSPSSIPVLPNTSTSSTTLPIVFNTVAGPVSIVPSSQTSSTTVLGSTRRPRVSVVGDPPPYPLSGGRINNLDKYRPFIQISDLVNNSHQQQKSQPKSHQQKSHPILTKSLAVSSPEPEKLVSIEKLAADSDKLDDIESSLDSYRITKLGGSEDGSNTTSASNATGNTSNNATNVLSYVSPNKSPSHANAVNTNDLVQGHNPKVVVPNSLKSVRKNPNAATLPNIVPVTSLGEVFVNTKSPALSNALASLNASTVNNPLATTNAMKSPLNPMVTTNATLRTKSPTVTTGSGKATSPAPLTMASMNLMLLAPPSQAPAKPKKPPPGLKPLKPLPGLKALPALTPVANTAGVNIGNGATAKNVGGNTGAFAKDASEKMTTASKSTGKAATLKTAGGNGKAAKVNTGNTARNSTVQGGNSLNTGNSATMNSGMGSALRLQLSSGNSVPLSLGNIATLNSENAVNSLNTNFTAVLNADNTVSLIPGSAWKNVSMNSRNSSLNASNSSQNASNANLSALNASLNALNASLNASNISPNASNVSLNAGSNFALSSGGSVSLNSSLQNNLNLNAGNSARNPAANSTNRNLSVAQRNLPGVSRNFKNRQSTGHLHAANMNMQVAAIMNRNAVNRSLMLPPVAAPPCKRLTEEVDISVELLSKRRDLTSSCSEPELSVEEIPWKSQSAEVSIVDCLSRMDSRFSPITFTPNGEDTVTISPIVTNDGPGGKTGGVSQTPKQGGATVFERLSAVKRLNDGESLDTVARSMNVPPATLAEWSRKFEKLARRQKSGRNMGGMLPGYGGFAPES